MAEAPPEVVLPPDPPERPDTRPVVPALIPSGSAARLLTSITPEFTRNDLGGYYGVQFTPNTTMVFNKIGIRAGAVGLTEPRTVSIQESAAATGVARGLVDLSAATNADQFVYADIAEVTLSAGVTYDLFGMEYPGDGHFVFNQTPCTLRDCSSWLSIAGWAGYVSGLGLSGYAYIGVDLDYGTPTTVLVPGNDYWDIAPATWTSNTAFTPDRLTAYPIANGTTSYCRSTFSRSSGKWHIEDTVVSLSPGTHAGVGFAARFIDWGEFDQAFYVFNSSYAAIRVGYVDVLALPAAFYKPNDSPSFCHIALEVDFDAKTLRVNNLTNGSGWSDPADISTLTGSPWFVAIGHLANGVQTDQDTINFGGTPFKVPPSPGYVAWAPFSTPPVTGTLNVTQAAQTLSATGKVLVAGALARAQGAQTLSATGKVLVAGALAQTQGAQTLSSAGKVLVAGALTQTQAAQTLSATGKVAVVGTLTQTQAGQTLSATGKVLVAGALTETQAAQTLAATGLVGLIGTFAATEPADTAAMTGGVAWRAALAATEASDTAAVVGTVRWLGALAATEVADSAAIAARTEWAATLAATEASDTAAFSGTVVTAGVISGSVATTEAADTGAISAQLTAVAGTLATTEVSDSATAAGAVLWSATLAATEAADVAAIGVDLRWLATLAATETGDSALGSGTVVWFGTVAATEVADKAAIAGIAAGANLDGYLVVTEAADTAAIAAQLTGVAGAFAASEASDSAAGVGTVAWTATLAATEASDTAASAGTVGWLAALAATEAADAAAVSGAVLNLATLAAAEAPDRAAGNGLVHWLGSLFVREAPDHFASSGVVFDSVGSFGNLAAIEATDGAVFAGRITGIVGTLAAFERADAFRATAGEWRTDEVVGRKALQQLVARP